MRIIAGKLRHRKIEMTNLRTTRETQDKIREAIFNMIGPYFDGGSALDLFAGSGAMAIEAYSRGIEEITMNDIEDAAIKVCKKNCLNLNIKNALFYQQDYQTFLKKIHKKWNLIFLDPPYSMDNIEEILLKVGSYILENGYIVFEMSSKSNYPEFVENLRKIKEKNYGIKRVVIYTTVER